MSEREFEHFLALLGGMLRLSHTQRQAISSELRDHLEERLAALRQQGCGRTEAIQAALEEFGDAAGLAAEFVHVFQRQKRRWVMRMTVATVSLLLAAALLATAFWPDTGSVRALVRVQAEQKSQPRSSRGNSAAARQTATIDENNAATEAQLAQRIAAQFLETPLTDVLADLSHRGQFQVYINSKQLDEVGVDPHQPVSIDLTQVRVDMLLDLLLDQMDLVYIVRDGILIITTPADLENALEVRVYNCRDLLGMERGQSRRRGQSGGMDGMGGGMDMGGQMAGGMLGMGMDAGGAGMARPPVDSLMQILTTSVMPDSWQVAGGPGTVAAYNGLLVVNHNPGIHRQIARVLDMLRKAAATKAGATVQSPRK